MTRRSATHTLPLSLAAALTSVVAFLSWGSFFASSGDLLIPLTGGILLITLTGFAARSARLPAVLVVSLQLFAVFLAANAAWGTSRLPTPDSVTEVVRHLDASIAVLSQWAAPVPNNVDVAVAAPLLGALLLHLLVDLFALTLRRVPLAGLPLLAIQTVPISILDRGMHWLLFAAAAGCFLLMLCLQEGMRIGAWGRAFGVPRDDDLFRSFDSVTPGRHPWLIGGLAVGCAVLLAAVAPTFDTTPFGSGGGGGGGSNEVRITNPIADLHRDLERGEDIPLLTVRADGIRPTYFRISALTQYSGVTWSPGARDLPADNAAEGPVPDPPGLERSVPRTERLVEVAVEDTFSSLWLPTSLRVSHVEANADWRWDDEVMDFHSAEDDIDTAGLEYSFRELESDFTGDDLKTAPPARGPETRKYLSLPDDLPAIVGDLADQVTRGVETDYEKAVALQQWFRSPENFTYSLDRADGAVVRNDNAALEEFLSDDGRVGYCEQFSASMALMARSLGIPARVSVGFLRPEHVAAGTYVFSSHDLHAWPELWFEGYGWVMFEPTPQDRATTTPSYTQGGEAPDVTPNEPSQEPTTADPTTQPSQQPSAAPEDPEIEATPERSADEERSRAWLWVVPVVILLAGLPLLPGWLRRRRTRERLGADDLEAAWAELRDVVTDLGRAWPEGRSPRETGSTLTTWLGAVPPPPREVRPLTGAMENPEAAGALDDLVAALEELRYAPAGTASGNQPRTDLDTERCVLTITAALQAGATPRARRRARWWPASLFR